MGWIDRLLGRPPRPIESRDGVCVIRQRAIAEHLQRPAEGYYGDATGRTCGGCGVAMRAEVISTGGPLGEADVWRDVPVCVDGWVCVKCGVFHYPRKVDAEEVARFISEGARCGNAGDYALAEWWFTRVVWDWPGFVPGHVNLAEATRTRLARSEGLDPAVARRLTARMRAQYEEAVESYERDPHDAYAAPIARACLTLAELAVDDRAPDRARRALATFAALPGTDAESVARAAALHRHLDLRLDLFQAAASALHPYLDIMHRAPATVDTPEARKMVYGMLELLESYGLFMRRHWAELLTIIATSLPVPIELYEIWDHATVSRVAVLVFNLAIVGYLYARRRGFLTRKQRKILKAAQHEALTGSPPPDAPPSPGA